MRWWGWGGLGGAGSRAAVRLAVGHPASQSRRCSGTQKPVPWEWGERPLACTLLPAGAEWGEALGASPGLLEEEHREGKVAGQVLHPLSTWSLWLFPLAWSPLLNPEIRSRKDLTDHLGQSSHSQ